VLPVDKFLVYQKDASGPAAHALIIGVGEYPYLIGGSKERARNHDGMEQLSSPPHSARAMADWLIGNYRNPAHPLATVAMLISEKNNKQYSRPGQVAVDVERATVSNASEAVKAWKRRGDGHEQNLILFYFCGHGLAKGPDTSLLMEDYNADEQAPLDGAVDFRKLHLGLNKCKARHQLYFIDACRAPTSTILDAYDYGGVPIIYGSIRQPRGLPARQAPVFYSTLAGKNAYGRSGACSIYTEALLKALHGAADDAEADAKWRIDTHTLNRSVQFLLERAAERGNELLQVNPVDNLTGFTLHELDRDPAVPVAVSCHPQKINTEAEMSCSDGQTVLTRDAPDPCGWDVELAPGDYKFRAVVSGDPDREGEQDRSVRPPFRRVEVQVQP
jgi:hypothetical protein